MHQKKKKSVQPHWKISSMQETPTSSISTGPIGQNLSSGSGLTENVSNENDRRINQGTTSTQKVSIFLVNKATGKDPRNYCSQIRQPQEQSV